MGLFLPRSQEIEVVEGTKTVERVDMFASLNSMRTFATSRPGSWARLLVVEREIVEAVGGTSGENMSFV
jgi:hypothetical protein